MGCPFVHLDGSKPGHAGRVEDDMKLPLLVVSFCAFALPAVGQEPAPEPYKPVFPMLFAKPSGANGFEEILQAGDLAKTNKTLDWAVDSTATLTQKRQALATPELRRALSLLRAGLAKKRVFPRTPGEFFAEAFAPLRALARLLFVEQYVLLADGRVGAAIDSLRDGLTLGHSIAGEMLIGSLVTSAIDSMVVRGIALHLDLLSAKDCERLMKLGSDWLSLPDPGISALEAEREFTRGHIRTHLGADPGLAAEVFSLLSARISAIQNMLRHEPWKRGALPPLQGSAAAVAHLKELEVGYEQFLEVFTRSLARVQLLGVHAAIRRFRWEHNRLPATLEELELGRLALDPFTGRPFLYQTAGDSTYILKSAKVERL